MIKKLSLLFMLIMSLILAFFCVEYHKNSILVMFALQPKDVQVVEKIVKKVVKPPKSINTNHIPPIIESVERIEPVVVIKVDESEPTKPIIKKLSTQELLGEEPVKEVVEKAIPIVETPTPTNYKPMVIEKPIVDERKIEKNNISDLSELERLMLEEMKNFK